MSTVSVAQTTTANPTASVSGHVTIAGKSAEGITVVAIMNESMWKNRTVAKTVTDVEGNYSLTRLSAGQFTITPIARAFVVGAGDVYKQPGQTVIVTENESVTKIDFALVRGGVITGRVNDLEGRPVIGELINVASVEGFSVQPVMGTSPLSRSQTDDRGVYRVYGLGPGNYKISVGRAASGDAEASYFGTAGSQYTRTYYPGVADESKATAIEISEGTEVTNIDITPGKFARGFSVSGNVVDADSGQPVANVFIAYATVSGENQNLGGANFTGGKTDANGKFRIEGIEPGNYAAFTTSLGQENSYSDPTPFYVSSGDVTGIEIKVRQGATIEGVAVIDNNSELVPPALLQSASLFAYGIRANGNSAYTFRQAKINPDGSFQFSGFAPGRVMFRVTGFPIPPKGLDLLRTEVQGQVQPNGIEVTAGARVTGVRLVLVYGTGKIRGEVKTESGVWPEGMRVMLTIHAVGGMTGQYDRNVSVDTRGRFVAENLPPGTYELRLRSTSEVPAFETVKQPVTVANGVEVPVTIVINLAPKAGGPQ